MTLHADDIERRLMREKEIIDRSTTPRQILREILSRNDCRGAYHPDAVQHYKNIVRNLRDDVMEARGVLEQWAESEITPTAHTDHPLRHFDRTCPACVEEQNAAPINAATQEHGLHNGDHDSGHTPAVAAPSAGTPRTDVLRFSYQRRAAELGRSLGPEDALDLAADFERSLTAANEQIERLKAESARTPRTGTHWPGCGMEGGHRHYECLQRDFERLKAELAEYKARAERAEIAQVEAARSATQPTADGSPFGSALAMRVMQSDLYRQLDDLERAECDALTNSRMEWLRGVGGKSDG